MAAAPALRPQRTLAAASCRLPRQARDSGPYAFSCRTVVLADGGRGKHWPAVRAHAPPQAFPGQAARFPARSDASAPEPACVADATSHVVSPWQDAMSF